jgi:hypothetical protein
VRVTKAGRVRTLGIVLGAGAVYDLAFGVAILAFPGSSAALLGLEVPDDPVYLYLNGVFLVMLAGIYGAASRRPAAYPLVAPIAGIGRVAGFLLFVWAWTGGRPTTFLALGLVDLTLGSATVAAWLRLRLSD